MHVCVCVSDQALLDDVGCYKPTCHFVLMCRGVGTQQTGCLLNRLICSSINHLLIDTKRKQSAANSICLSTYILQSHNYIIKHTLYIYIYIFIYIKQYVAQIGIQHGLLKSVWKYLQNTLCGDQL